jgi:hypothetical protein
MRIQYGGWEPDAVSVGATDANGGVLLEEARNVYPGRRGYQPILALAETAQSALPSACRGLAIARDGDGAFTLYAGTATKLYRYNSSTNAWVDFTRSSGGDYALEADDYWSFTQFGSLLIAVAPTDDPQHIDVDTADVNFAALGGSPPRARHVAVVGDFVVLGGLTSNDRSLQWSSINNAEEWTAGTNLGDVQVFPDGGAVTSVKGGEFGWVVQDTALRRMSFHAGSDVAFTFERIENEHGSPGGYSAITSGGRLFFLDDDGFYAHDGQTLTPIGTHRVDEWFRANSDIERFFRFVGFHDPLGPRVMWAFFNSTASTYFDRVIIYDWSLDKWSYSDQAAQFWATVALPGWTLEGLDIYGTLEAVPYSLDSRVWAGGRPALGGINSDGMFGFLEGSPQTALIRTGSMQLDGKRAMVRSIEPIGIVNDATMTGRVGRRENSGDAISYTSSLSASSRTGVMHTHASGRLHNLEITATQSSGTNWSYLQGLDVEVGGSGQQ